MPNASSGSKNNVRRMKKRAPHSLVISYLQSHPTHTLAIIFFFALLFRLILIPNPGFEADVAFWKSWGLATLDGGIVWGLENTNNNYPTPFSYVLGFMVWIYRLFADPHNWYEYWNNNNQVFLTVSKMFPIAADFGIAGLILWIGRRAKKFGFPDVGQPFYILLVALYLLNPVTLMDGAWWGQVDSMGVFLYMLAVIIALNKRPGLAGVIYMVSMMTKLQNMIYGPLFFLFLWYQFGFRGLTRGIIGAFSAFLLLNIEFLLAGKFDRVLLSLTMNYDFFPWMSLNAYNLWWIFSGAQGMETSDKLLSFGIIPAKTMGLMIFSTLYLLAVLPFIEPVLTKVKRTALMRGKIARKKVEGVTSTISSRGVFLLLVGLIVVANAFFLFQTQSHDRYAFPMTVYLLLLIPFFPKHMRSVYIFLYGVWSIFYFYNLHTALIVNYPNNGLPILSDMTWPALTISVSVVFLASFGIFLIALRKRLPWWSYAIPGAALTLGVLAMNFPLLAKRPVTLTKFTPIIAEQSYGFRAVNMPVDADKSHEDWSRLSVQYHYYSKGFGTHANSVMNFDIGGHFTRFSTDYGIDTRAGGAGTATFEIYGDGELLFQSDVIGRYDDPRHAEVDITGVHTLGLVTTDAGDGIDDDHTDWLNPLLWP